MAREANLFRYVASDRMDDSAWRKVSQLEFNRALLAGRLVTEVPISAQDWSLLVGDDPEDIWGDYPEPP